MKFFLLAGLLALFCCVVHGFSGDPEAREKAKGRWHAVALSSDDPHILKHSKHMKIVVVDVDLEEDGVVIRTQIPTPQGCRDVKMLFTPGDDGKYYHKCKWAEKKVDVVETDGETYAIVDVTIAHGGKTYQTSSLYVRDPEAQPIGLIENFQRRSEEKGFTPEQIHIFPREMACQEKAE